MIHLLLVIIYLTFISLGLPDALLGSAWPVMYTELNVDFAASGLIFAIISGSTVVSSLSNNFLSRKLKTRHIVLGSVFLTALALYGFSISRSYLALCLWAVPYGLGAGSIDAALNNYIALYYSAKHMNWLHCMWGVGAMTGPYIMSMVLTGGGTWNMGYRSVSMIQLALAVMLIISMPVWKKHEQLVKQTEFDDQPIRADHTEQEREKFEQPSNSSLTIWQALKLPGSKEIILTFLCYCGLEQSIGLWASSYLFAHHGISGEKAAAFGGLFFIGLTAGRFLSGFATLIFDDIKMIKLGEALLLLGVIILFMPLGETTALLGLIIIGFGSAPIFPCIIHSTPQNFGRRNSPVMIGLQMASAYMGNIILPPFLGLLGDLFGIAVFPYFLLVVFVIMALSYRQLLKMTGQLT